MRSLQSSRVRRAVIIGAASLGSVALGAAAFAADVPIPGLSRASASGSNGSGTEASSGDASAAAVDIPGVLTVSETSAHGGVNPSGSATSLRLLGTDVAGTTTGPVGGGVSTTNTLGAIPDTGGIDFGCDGDPAATACVGLLGRTAAVVGSAFGSGAANAYVLAVGAGANGVLVAPSTSVANPGCQVNSASSALAIVVLNGQQTRIAPSDAQSYCPTDGATD